MPYFPTSPAPTIGDVWPEAPAEPVWEFDGSVWQPISEAIDTEVVTSLPTTGTINLDFLALHKKIATIALTGNPTFTTSNRARGRETQLRLEAGGAARIPAWPAEWLAFGADLPATLASGSVWTLSFRCLGTTEASVDVVAVAAV